MGNNTINDSSERVSNPVCDVSQTGLLIKKTAIVIVENTQLSPLCEQDEISKIKKACEEYDKSEVMTIRNSHKKIKRNHSEGLIISEFNNNVSKFKTEYNMSLNMISLTDDEIEHRHPGYIEGLFAASDSDGISYDSNINSTHEFHNQLISVQTKVTENENSFFSSVFHKICDGWNYLVKAFSSLLNFFRNKKDVIVKH